jgi:hypothetical protein
MNMHRPSGEGNFCDENREAKKHAIVKDYSQQRGRMINSYSISQSMEMDKKNYLFISWT